MWGAIGFVVAEILKFFLGKLMEPAKASESRGTLRVPVSGDELLSKLETNLRLAATPRFTSPGHPAASGNLGYVHGS